MQSLIKVEKEGKPHGKNPPPKREKSTIENRREEDLKKGNHPPQRGEEGDEVVPPPKRSVPSSEKGSDEEVGPRMQNGVSPLRKNQLQRYTGKDVWWP